MILLVAILLIVMLLVLKVLKLNKHVKRDTSLINEGPGYSEEVPGIFKLLGVQYTEIDKHKDTQTHNQLIERFYDANSSKHLIKIML